MTYIWQPVLLTCDLCYCTKFHYTLLCCVCLGGSEDCWFRMVSPRPFFQTFNSMWDSRLPSTWNGGEQTAWRKGVGRVDVVLLVARKSLCRTNNCLVVNAIPMRRRGVWNNLSLAMFVSLPFLLFMSKVLVAMLYSGTSENELPLLRKPPQCGQESTVPNCIALYYSCYKETSVLRTPPK